MDGALLVIDLDRFKQVNDGHGHRAGDRVLAEVAAVLRKRLRESDILARFGGDEFAVLMPHGGAPEAAELANLMVNSVRREVTTPAGPLDASVGYALFEDATTSSDEVLSRADDAMYADKAAGQRPDAPFTVGGVGRRGARLAAGLRSRPLALKGDLSGFCPTGQPAKSVGTAAPCGPPQTAARSLRGMRLAKFLAHAGVASRRAAEAIVAEGRVTVDGEVVTDPARDVDETSGVALDGRPVAPEPHEVHALNKPAGVVSTARDTHGRPTVVQLVRSPRRLYPVGRLDADTTGLILLTNDGDLADRLTHPRYGVKKVYRARVQPARVSPRALQALRDGVELEDGLTAPAQARQPAPGVLELTIREGRKRQVRRMVRGGGPPRGGARAGGLRPAGLRGLEPGKSRRLTKAEVERLRRLSEPGAERAGRAPAGRAKPRARRRPQR